ncbi:MAG: hypothetical protein CL878_09485 [Dehalococcoidia bacterium]|nr:hypothetical protein [Dehalococcoidia bacterium]
MLAIIWYTEVDVMTITVRELQSTLDDMQVVTRFVNAWLPEYLPRRTAEARLQDHMDACASSEFISFGFIAESDGEPVGVASAGNAGLAIINGAISLMVFIESDHRRQGIGKHLMDMASGFAADAGYTHWFTTLPEEHTDSLTWARAHGFEEVDRGYHLAFTVSTWDAATGRKILDETKGKGVCIASLVELQQEHEDWAERLQELCLSFAKDLPIAFNVAEMFHSDTEAFIKSLKIEMKTDFAGSFVALIDGEWAATAWLAKPEQDADWCGHSMTGVHPDYRRRGLVKALKQAGFDWARRKGLTAIHTHQQESNAPMLDLNRRLGFEVKTCMVTMRREIMLSAESRKHENQTSASDS